MTFPEWQQFSRQIDGRAAACAAAMVKRARKAAQAAGLDPSIPFLHAHNAMVSRSYGKPWREVDYSLARLVLHLEQRSFEPSRIASRIISRAWKTVQA